MDQSDIPAWNEHVIVVEEEASMWPLAVRGEAGAGKTTLLDGAVTAAVALRCCGHVVWRRSSSIATTVIHQPHRRNRH